MAFRFGDPGGRMYTVAGTASANILAHWTSVSAGTWSVAAGAGRLGGSSLHCAGSASLDKALSAQQTWGVAFAIHPNSTLAAGVLAAFLDGASLQAELRSNADGSLSVTRNGTLLAATAAGILSSGTYFHLEFKAKIASAVGGGAYDVWVNGVNKLTATGVNTQATANATASVVRVGSGGMAVDLDDVIVYDGQATDAAGNSAMTGPVGDCGLAWLLPTGAGTTTQWTPDSGANWARVSEATPDTTSYVESATIGQKDTYALADLAANVTGVKAVAACHYAEKTDVGSRQMGAVVRSGGADATHPTGIDLTNGYAYSFRAWDSDPNGGGAWTPTKVNALEIGQVVNT